MYDRACLLHTFCMLREPAFFANTIFRVDITHYKGHANCSEGYNPQLYRHRDAHASDAALPYLNTQMAEQWNALLRNIRTPAAFMTADHFLSYTRTFLARRNLRLMTSLGMNTGQGL